MGQFQLKLISVLWLLLSFLFLVGCGSFLSEPQKENKNLTVEVIYGEDNRKDFYELKDSDWQRLAQSTVALIDYRKLEQDSETKKYSIKATTYGHTFHLCPDERFFSQPTATFCSGFLIGPDLIATAGHCLRNSFNCENVRFLFGYGLFSPQQDPLQLEPENVYSCAELIHSEANGITGSDFAIARLDRKVIGYSPLPLRTQGVIRKDEKLTVIGYPSGLPGKWSDQGDILELTSSIFFKTSLDTYGGNSGSAVFNSQTRLVEGILVRGDSDFKFDPSTQCRRSNICLYGECTGEDVVRSELLLKYLTPNELTP